MKGGSARDDHAVSPAPGQESLPVEIIRPVIALVDDEPDLIEMAGAYLRHDGFQVLTAGDARGAAALLREHPIDLLVLDLGLPDGNGLDFLRGVRAGHHLPVIILTGWSEERERIVGLELGADDYVVKPFSLPELAARIRAVLRRTQPPPIAPVRQFGRLTVDTRSREATVDGASIALTPTEYELLAFLTGAPPRQVFTTSQLLAQISGFSDHRRHESTVAEDVSRIRRKLADAGLSRPEIVTVRGVGYRLDP